MVTYVPIREFVWTDDFSWLRTVTCRNHTDAKYFTKNPYDRSLHLIAVPKGLAPEDRTKPYGECKCSFADLVVVCDDNGLAVGMPDYAIRAGDVVRYEGSVLDEKNGLWNVSEVLSRSVRIWRKNPVGIVETIEVDSRWCKRVTS